MWYKNSYRRHLCDMHIDDWSPEFLSEFSPRGYFENLHKAHIDNTMIYLQSHVGLCYYPTNSGKMHSAFIGKEDAVKQLVELCRENGISVTGYYSLIYNNYAHNAHPDWRMTDRDGRSQYEASGKVNAEFASNSVCRYGICCPNNPDYREFVAEQIKEISEYFTLDGMFFDMLFWPQVCFCKHCRKRWSDEVGTPFPESFDRTDPEWQKLLSKRREWMGEFAHFAASTAKSLMPEISVEHNLAYAALPDSEKGLAEEVISASDYAGGDLYGDKYAQSFTCKVYKSITKNPPFEYMFSRCVQSLSKHTVTKSEDEMTSAVALTAAHHGATLVIDAIDPVGTLDERVYERLGNVFGKIMPYEKYFNGEMLQDAGLYYSLVSKSDLHGDGHTNHNCCVNLVKTLIRSNILCGITGELSVFDGYKAIIAPCLTEEDSKDFSRLTEFVKNGGKLYISGGDCPTLLKEFFCADIIGRTDESVTYIAPKEEFSSPFGWFNGRYPLHFDGSLPVAEGIGEEHVVAHITLPYTLQTEQKFASIHSNPPGHMTKIPAMAFTEYGKGCVLWSAASIENDLSYNSRNVFVSLINEFLSFEPSLVSDAPRDVEITVFDDKDKIYVNTVLLCDDDIARKAELFNIRIKCRDIPKKIELLPSGADVAFDYRDGYAVFDSHNSDIFNMYRILL